MGPNRVVGPPLFLRAVPEMKWGPLFCGGIPWRCAWCGRPCKRAPVTVYNSVPIYEVASLPVTKPVTKPKGGRPPFGDKAMSAVERMRRRLQHLDVVLFEIPHTLSGGLLRALRTNLFEMQVSHRSWPSTRYGVRYPWGFRGVIAMWQDWQ